MSQQRPSVPVEVKICGVTRTRDAELAVDLGAAYLGLNFYRESPRCLDLGAAREIADAVRGRTLLVGVVVDMPGPAVGELIERVGLDLVQFHGDESSSEVEPFADRAIRVFRWAEGTPPPDLAAWSGVRAWLFDTPASGLYGGTGRAWRYERLARLPSGPPIFVAGGIRPANVRSAWRASGAAAVDVCSGIESAPGVKDPELMRRLFAEVRNEE